MLLSDLQQLLAELYGVEPGHDVCDYLITDPELVRHVEPPEQRRDVDEKLLLVQHEDVLDVGLYLDEAVLERLGRADPRHTLDRHNLADFWTVLEGVSHFNYLAWNAGREQCVTLLELEMQAEVDKYLGARILFERQRVAARDRVLLHCLFEVPVLHAQLSACEAVRYRDASHLAGRYCHHLERRYPVDRLAAPMVDELRAFYRWPQPAKVSHIRATHFA